MPNVNVSGKIIHGDGRGRLLGFPTANLALDKPAAKLPSGIYAAAAFLPPNRTIHPAVIHTGPRPMFPESTPSFEVHLISFPDTDLYNHRLEVTVLARIRDIANFPDIAALQQAIRNDITKALAIFSQEYHVSSNSTQL